MHCLYCLSLSIFKVLPIFTENVLNVSATFSVSDITLQSSLNMLVPTILFEKFTLTTLQNFLLSVMCLTFKGP